MESKHKFVKQQFNGIEQKGNQIQGVLKDSLLSRAIMKSKNYNRPVKQRKNEAHQMDLANIKVSKHFLQLQLEAFNRLNRSNCSSFENWIKSRL